MNHLAHHGQIVEDNCCECDGEDIAFASVQWLGIRRRKRPTRRSLESRLQPQSMAQMMLVRFHLAKTTGMLACLIRPVRETQ